MPGLAIPSVAVRLIALLCSIVVLGISGYYVSKFDELDDLDGDHHRGGFVGGLERGFDYGVFVGVWGLLDGIVGLAAAFMTTSVLGLITLVFDGLAAIFFLAGGIDLAVALRPAHDSKIEADIAFMFIGFFATLAAAAMVFLNRRQEA